MTVRNTQPLAEADGPAFLEPLLSAFGSDRIAWGSNFPAAEQSLPTLVGLAERVLAGVSEQDRESIFSGTARKLYPALS